MKTDIAVTVPRLLEVKQNGDFTQLYIIMVEVIRSGRAVLVTDPSHTTITETFHTVAGLDAWLARNVGEF